MRTFGLACMFTLCLATPAFAQRERGPTNSETGDFVTVGAGAATLPDYEGSDDYRWAPVPGILARSHGIGFELVGTRLNADLIPDYTQGTGLDFQLGPTVNVNLNRNSVKGIEDPRIKALGKRGTAVELGGFVGVAKTGVITSDYDRLSVRVSYRHDISNVSDAGIFTPSFTYMTPLSRKAMVGTFFSATRVEKGYADAYFSVTPAGSAASGLPVYNAQGGWKDWTVGLGGMVSLTGDLTHGLQLVAGGTYRKLIGDFGDTPIVSVAGSRSQWLGTVGLAYTF